MKKDKVIYLNQFTKLELVRHLPQLIAFVELEQSKLNPKLARYWSYLLCAIGSDFDGRKENPFNYTINRLKPSLPNAPSVNIGFDTIALVNGRCFFKFKNLERVNVKVKETLVKWGFEFLFGSKCWELKIDDMNEFYKLIHELNTSSISQEFISHFKETK